MCASGQWISEAGKFEYIKKLGEGGFGEVWLADDPRRGEKVAVKFLHLKHCDQSNIEVFKREFEILAELKQVHLARVFDFGFSSDNEQYFLSTEFCPGKPLLEAIAGKPVSYYEEILVQILSALECIHSQGIIHFDIKPENVLVEDIEGHPNVKLVDFGVAVRLKAMPQQFGGTLAFIAPEVLARNPKLDHRVDLYSLGMVCLFCLTGRLPFRANDPEDVMEWHRSGSISPSLWKGREIPGYLREITEKLLAKNPSDRFSNSRVVLNFLNLATGGRYRHEEEELHAQIPIEGPIVERREEVLKPIQERMEKILFSAEAAPISSVYFLTGEAGLGKSRALEEIRHVVQVKEIRFLQIECDWNIPAWPKLEKWLEMPPLAGEQLDQHWQTRRRIDFLLDAAKKAPICLLVDDFHKADQDLRSLVMELTTQTRQAREAGQAAPLFLLVATEEEVEGGVKLPQLSPKAISTYLKLVLGERMPIENLAEVLYQYSGGLPLLMVEGLRFLAPHFFRGEPLENLVGPDKIHLLYQEKLQQLKPEEEELLLILALLFRSASESELLSILGHDGASFVTIVENCLKLGLLSGNPYGDPVYRVSSQALALDLIASLEAERRRALHEKIVQGLARSPETQSKELAYHYAKAGRHAEAVRHYRESGEAMEKEGKIGSACDCLQKAVDLMEEGSEAWQQAVLKAFRLSILSGNYSQGESYREKLAPYPSWEREEVSGWLYFKTRKFPQAREHYSEATKMLPESDLLHRILIENAIGNIDLQEGRVEDAIAKFRNTLGLEAGLPEEEKLQIKNNNLGLSLSLAGRHGEAIQFFQQRRGRCDSYNSSDTLSFLNAMGYACLKGSRYQETISVLKKAMTLAEQSGALHALYSVMGNLLTALLKENRYIEALSILQKMDVYQRKFGTRKDVAHNLLRQGSVYLTLGMGEYALGCFQEGLKVSREIGESLLVGWFLLMLAYWERGFGAAAKAEEFFKQAAAEAEPIANQELKALANYGLADLLVDQGNREACQKILRDIVGNAQDHEFEIRLRLLRAKAALEQDAAGAFSELEKECLKNNYRELLWELYHAWGKERLAKKSREEAIRLLEKGVQMLQGIAASLPEEYRSRYLGQNAQKNLIEDLEKEKNPPKGGFMARIRKILPA